MTFKELKEQARFLLEEPNYVRINRKDIESDNICVWGEYTDNLLPAEDLWRLQYGLDWGSGEDSQGYQQVEAPCSGVRGSKTLVTSTPYPSKWVEEHYREQDELCSKLYDGLPYVVLPRLSEATLFQDTYNELLTRMIESSCVPQPILMEKNMVLPQHNGFDLGGNLATEPPRDKESYGPDQGEVTIKVIRAGAPVTKSIPQRYWVAIGEGSDFEYFDTMAEALEYVDRNTKWKPLDPLVNQE
jgi:hypothetical protein